MNLDIRKFDPKKIDSNRVCVFIGKRGTGKSTLVADILYYHRKIPVGLAMSATEESNSFYAKYIPPLYIYNDFNTKAVEKLIQSQRKKIKKHRGELKTCDPESLSSFLLLDDCMYDKSWTKDVNIRGIFMNGRHWKILFFLTMQYCMDITPDLRTNIDYVFILRENIIKNRKKIYENFFGIFPTYDSFSEVMDQCTENFDCLVLDNTAHGNKIEDCVFWYRAKRKRKFRIGSEAVWRYSHQHFNSHYDSDEDEEKRDILTKLKEKKKKTVIHVKRTNK